ncbi:MAG: sigma-70 family RNA polymerase sigma factor [Lachnospiraceae bacterium]|nr:sigma-70 family RNA polymerase sigma factor [Lachnospiraceae bacterium]
MTKQQFAQLVLDSTDSLYRVSRGILRNDAECEDAVWEAIGIGFARLDTLRQDEYARTWLTRILIHECYRVLRQQKLRADMPEGLEQHPAGEKQNYSDLYDALKKLSERYRAPIVLFYLEGYSVREIADILECTEGTVKSWLSRGRSKLKKILEEEL